MKHSVRRMGFAGAASMGLALVIGPAAVPAMAAPAAHLAAPSVTQAAVEPAPAPTGLAYTYDSNTQTVTVTWDPKSPTDTVTQYYNVGSCNNGVWCSILVSEAVYGNTYQYQQAPGTTRNFAVWAVNSTFQRTASEILPITT
ncbi:hypothetical protein ACF1FC_13420 [Streptomyces sp. NPDC014344]